MLEQILQGYITHGREETYLEYKSSRKWFTKQPKDKHKVSNLEIVKAMLAMSNHLSGGVIVIGEKEKGNGEFKPTGVNKVNSDSFKYDDISRYLKGFSNPQLQFKVTRDAMEINGKKKKFVVIQVTESLEFPVICTKAAKYNNSQGFHSDNILLRENAIYIRSKSPIESREISSVQEWRELIYITMKRSERELLKKMPCFEYLDEKKKKKPEEKELIRKVSEFERQLKKDNL